MEQKPSTALVRLLEKRNAPTPTAPPSRLVRRPEVCDMTGLPKSTLYDYLQAGTFPAPVKLSARSVAWRLSEVEAWIAGRVSARPSKAV